MFNVAENYRRIVNFLSSIRVSYAHDRSIYNTDRLSVFDLSLQQLSEYRRALRTFEANPHPYVDEEALQETIETVEEEIQFRTTL